MKINTAARAGGVGLRAKRRASDRQLIYQPAMAIPRWRRKVALLGVLIALGVTATAVASSSPPAGSVHQASGKAGCYTSDGSSEAGPGTCHNIRGGDHSTTLTISPDGHFAYLVGYGDSPGIPPVLSVLRRDSKNGTLKQLPGKSGCFSRDGLSEDGPNTCSKARDLDTGDATSIVISSDGRYLYVASQYEPASKPIGGIAIFKRNRTTGTLHQLSGKAGCVSSNGASQNGPRTCARARGRLRLQPAHHSRSKVPLCLRLWTDPHERHRSLRARHAERNAASAEGDKRLHHEHWQNTTKRLKEGVPSLAQRERSPGCRDARQPLRLHPCG